MVKYYHSEVSTCKVNWDSVMLNRLPLIKAAVTKNDLNDQLSALITAAGPTAKASGVLADNIAPELKYNRNFSWLKDNMLRTDVSAALDTIRVNFRPHASCWVLDNDYQSSYSGWLVFPKDSTPISKILHKFFPMNQLDYY